MYPVTGPARTYAAVTPNDDADLPGGSARALYVGVAGDVVVVNHAGAAVTFKQMAVGWHPLVTSRVRATGTDATNIIAVHA